MIETKYINETIATLEVAVQEECFLENDDYQKLCLSILKCDKYLLDKKIKATIENDWYEELTALFYEKMRLEMELNDED